jgi:hypothetical protein
MEMVIEPLALSGAARPVVRRAFLDWDDSAVPLTGAPPTLLLTAGHTCVRDTTGTLPLALSVPERAESSNDRTLASCCSGCWFRTDPATRSRAPPFGGPSELRRARDGR